MPWLSLGGPVAMVGLLPCFPTTKNKAGPVRILMDARIRG